MNDPIVAMVVDKDGNEIRYTKRYLHAHPLSTKQIAENFGVCVEHVEGYPDATRIIRDPDGFKQVRYDYFRDADIRELFCTPGCYYSSIEIYDISATLTVSKIFFTGRRDFVITIQVYSIFQDVPIT